MLEFIVTAFAVYRISRMIAVDTGAFRVFQRTRDWVSNKFGETSWEAEGIACIFCVSFWVALIMMLFLQTDSILNFVINWLGLAGAAAWLYRQER